MRNLKRVLSLALAVVMVIGMMVMTTGAADSTKLADYDEITYVEAVDVMVALGILEGDENGYYNPEQILTREQAAKIICYMLMGPNNAEKLSKNTSIFVDVAAGRWSAGFIAYCANLGIISGWDGKFDPAGELTGVAFGKMLLTALGYDAEVEGYVNSDNWATNIAVDMIAAGVDVDGMTMDDPVSRDVAAQMAFNALTANTVYYSTKTEVNTGSANVTVSGGRHDIDRSGVDYRGFNETNDGYQQFCEQYFPKLTCRAGTDAFMRPTTEWFLRGTFVGAYLNNPTLTYTKSVSMGDLYKDLGLSKAVKVTYIYEDGKLQAEKTIARGDMKTRIGDNGVLTEVYKYVDDLGNVTVKITSINTYVATVAAVTAATKASDRFITLASKSEPESDASLLNKTFETDYFAVKDLVAFTAAWDGVDEYEIITVADLEKTTTGLLTEWVGETHLTGAGQSENEFTIDNATTYKYSANCIVMKSATAEGTIADFAVNKSNINVYEDEYGYALYVNGVGAPKNYAALIGFGETNQYGSETRGATLLLPDGTKKEVLAKLATGLAWTDFSVTGGGKNLVTEEIADIVTYNVDDSGIYTLSYDKTTKAKYDATTYNAANEIQFTNGKSLFTLDDGDGAEDYTLYTTSETVFMVCTDAKVGKAYNVYTGYNEMPSIDASVTNMAIAYVLDTTYGNQINYVYLYAKNLAGVSGVDTFFVKQEKHDIITDSTGSYYVVPAVVEGEITTLKVDVACPEVDNNAKGGEFGLFAIKNVIKNNYGIIVSFDDASADFNATGAAGVTGSVAANEVVLGMGGTVTNEATMKNTATYWAYNDSTTVYVVDKGYKSISISDVASVTDDLNDKVYAARTLDTRILTNVIIVTVEEAAPTPPTPPTVLNSASLADTVTETTLTVNYVDGEETAGAAIEAALTANGYTVTEIKNTAGTWSAKATKGVVSYEWTSVTANAWYTVKVNGELVAYMNSGTGASYTPAGAATGFIYDSTTDDTYAYAAYAATTFQKNYHMEVTTGYYAVAAATTNGSAVKGLTPTVTTDKTYAKAGDVVTYTFKMTGTASGAATVTLAGTAAKWPTTIPTLSGVTRTSDTVIDVTSGTAMGASGYTVTVTLTAGAGDVAATTFTVG